MEFDFNTWAKLAKEDPAEFERWREATLRAAIDAAPEEHRKRLEGLQFRLNLERAKAPTPLASCVRMNTLMWSGFHRLRKELMQIAEPGRAEEATPRSSAEVIPMRAFAKSKNPRTLT
jgi:hypothetical protein